MNSQTPVKDDATTQAISRRDDDESRLDAAIAESFPASDPVAVAQPGSLLAEQPGTVDTAERYAAVAIGAAAAVVLAIAIRVVVGPGRHPARPQ